MSDIFKELCAMLNVRKICTSIRRPQTNGIVERFNKADKNDAHSSRMNSRIGIYILAVSHQPIDQLHTKRQDTRPIC